MRREELLMEKSQLLWDGALDRAKNKDVSEKKGIKKREDSVLERVIGNSTERNVIK